MNSSSMICRNVLISLLAASPWVMAESAAVAPVEPTKESAGAVVVEKPFSLDFVIAPILKNMAVPQTRPKIVGAELAIASPSEKARTHVQQGFALVHAQWDFEAYRHFCVALQEDPDCLMAYCGVALSLARPHNEYVAYRRAAVDRMLDLMEADVAREAGGEAGRFPEVEKEFAAAVATLVSTSPRTAGAMFHQIALKYPKFIQAHVLALFLSRGGYDMTGDPMPGQVIAVKRARQLLKAFPENPMVMSFWLSLNVAAPLTAMDFEKELLPCARRLVQIDPEFPSWHYMLGFYEWRVGNHGAAEKAFGKAAELYAHWMKEESVGVNDCEGYIKSKCYQANALYQSGHFDEAMKVAKEVRAIKLDPTRPQSQGNAMLLWCGYNLPARLYLTRGDQGDLDKALKSLPGKKELSAFVTHKKYPTLAGVYTDALSLYLGCRKAIEQKDLKAAKELHRDVFRKQIMNMASVSKGATQVSDYAHFLRAGNCLAVYDAELAGLISWRGPKATRVVALGQFLTARDKQQPPSVMISPLVLMPMDNRLGDYYLSVGNGEEALGAYQDGNKLIFNNVASLRGMKKSLLLLEKKEESDVVQERMDGLLGEE